MIVKTFILAIIKKGNKKIKPIAKFRRLAITEAIGMNSRGTRVCLKIEELDKNEPAASEREFVKKNQGIIPDRTNKV
ncbi:MAG: hypothetical protein WC315_01030 [Candidatus Omnitrophota bacterium]